MLKLQVRNSRLLTHSKTSGAQTSFLLVCPRGVTWTLSWHQASSVVKVGTGVVLSVTPALYKSEQLQSGLITELFSLTRKKPKEFMGEYLLPIHHISTRGANSFFRTQAIKV